MSAIILGFHAYYIQERVCLHGKRGLTKIDQRGTSTTLKGFKDSILGLMRLVASKVSTLTAARVASVRPASGIAVARSSATALVDKRFSSASSGSPACLSEALSDQCDRSFTLR